MYKEKIIQLIEEADENTLKLIYEILIRMINK